MRFWVEFPDSNSDTAKIIGMGVCGGVLYCSIQMILIGIWHQRYLYEKSLRPVVKREIKPPSPIYNPASVEPVPVADRSNAYIEDLDTTKEHLDYAPAQFTIINEQVLLRQPGAATGAGSYDSVVWPSNIEVQDGEEKPKAQTQRVVNSPLPLSNAASKRRYHRDEEPSNITR